MGRPVRAAALGVLCVGGALATAECDAAHECCAPVWDLALEDTIFGTVCLLAAIVGAVALYKLGCLLFSCAPEAASGSASGLGEEGGDFSLFVGAPGRGYTRCRGTVTLAPDEEGGGALRGGGAEAVVVDRVAGLLWLGEESWPCDVATRWTQASPPGVFSKRALLIRPADLEAAPMVGAGLDPPYTRPWRLAMRVLALLAVLVSLLLRRAPGLVDDGSWRLTYPTVALALLTLLRAVAGWEPWRPPRRLGLTDFRPGLRILPEEEGGFRWCKFMLLVSAIGAPSMWLILHGMFGATAVLEFAAVMEQRTDCAAAATAPTHLCVPWEDHLFASSSANSPEVGFVCWAERNFTGLCLDDEALEVEALCLWFNEPLSAQEQERLPGQLRAGVALFTCAAALAAASLFVGRTSSTAVVVPGSPVVVPTAVPSPPFASTHPVPPIPPAAAAVATRVLR